MTGTRRFTMGIAMAREYAEQYKPNGSITRTRCLGALKQAAPALGLSLAGLGLVDMLFATSEDQDWLTPGVRPIVWPSNDWLCEQTQLSLSSLRRALRELVDLGLIAPADSPNGHRWGRRTESGRITEAYGFDLSPIGARYMEFIELAADTRARRTERRELRREFTILRRAIEMITGAGMELALPGDWIGFRSSLDRIVDRRKTEPLQELINALRDLRIVVEDTFNQVSNRTKEKPKGASYDTHILTTTELDLSKSNQRSDAYAPQHNELAGSAGDGFSRKPVRVGSVVQVRKPPRSEENSEIEQISIGLVNAACPEIGMYAYSVDNWRGLVEAAERVRHKLGVSNDAWYEARSTLGENLAAVAIAVILQKQLAGEVKKPGGYLRGMVSKAHAGELHVARTLYGLSERSAPGH